MYDTPEDADARIRDGLLTGRESALAEAYDTHAAVVYGIALHITRDPGAAEDIVQEVFVELWRRPERFDPQRSRLRGWLCMIGRRRAIDGLRRRRTQEQHRQLLAVPNVVLPYVEDEVMTSLTHKQVRKAVNELPETLRRVILLAYFQGLTYQEVGTALGIPEGTAKSRLRIALHRLADQLA